MIFLWTDICFFICLCFCSWIFCYLRKSIIAGGKIVILHTPYLVVSLLVFIVMLVIAILDSIHWSGAIISAKYSASVVSVLDMILYPLNNPLEVSYSAPMAKQLFSLSTHLQSDGTIVQKYDDLVYIGTITSQEKLIIIGIGLCSAFSVMLLSLRRESHEPKLSKRLALILRGKTIIAWRTMIVTSVFLASLLAYIYFASRYCHILGTDKIGTDVLYMGLKSIRTGFIIGLVSLLFMMPFAIILGISAGYFGGRIDSLIQFIYITLSSIPGILLIASALLATDIWLLQQHSWSVVQKADLRLLMIALIIGITGWTPLCRLLRAEAMKLKTLDFVIIAKLQRRRHFSIILRELLPNTMHLVMIVMILDFSGLVLAEAILSYIGVGVDPSTYSWGNMINVARLELARDPLVWWPLATAFGMMFILVLSANLLADRLAQVLDPKKHGDF